MGIYYSNVWNVSGALTTSCDRELNWAAIVQSIPDAFDISLLAERQSVRPGGRLRFYVPAERYRTRDRWPPRAYWSGSVLYMGSVVCLY